MNLYLTTVIARKEAVLQLEMLSNVEITGYEEPPPVLEHVNLTQEVKSRQRFQLEYDIDLPGPLLQIMHCTVTKKEPVLFLFMELSRKKQQKTSPCN